MQTRIIHAGGSIVVPCHLAEATIREIWPTLEGAVVSYEPDDGDVRAECYRRLRQIVGARDDTHLGIIIGDDAAEMLSLTLIATPTAEQANRRAELTVRHLAVEVLWAAYNAMPEAPVPADYAADGRWM